METAPTEHRKNHGFPTDQPMDALKKDHDFVRKLFDHYLNTQDMNVKKEAGPQILLALEMHMALEETVFYPRVHDVDPSLVDQGEEEHHQAKQLIQQLKNMNAGDAQCDQMFGQLRDAILHHVETEERDLFPKVQSSNLDLNAIGLEMAAFEANMVASQAQMSDRTDVRR